MNKDWLIGAIAVIIVAAIIGIQVFLSSLTPNYDWTESYSINSDQPYGLSAMYDLLSEKEGFTRSNRPIDELLSDSLTGTYLLITNDMYLWEESDSLLQWVAHGNQAFFSLNEVPWFLDSIVGYNLDSALQYYYSDSAEISLAQSINPDSTMYFFRHRVVNDTTPRNWKFITDSTYYWEIEEQYNIQSLGRYYYGHNFFKIPHGEGVIYVHTEPILFTNYYLFTSRGFEYTNYVLSQLPEGNIFWDNYHNNYHYEDQEDYQSNEARDSVLKVFFGNRAFKVMWVVMLIGIVLFLVFRGKREQRIIPLIHYPENTSRDYAKALGALYHRSGEPKYIASEMINMFHNHNRRKYHIAYKVGDETYAKALAKRAKVKEQLIVDILAQERKIIYNDMAKMRDIIGFYELLNIYYKSSK